MSRILDELKDAVLSCSMEEKLPHRWVDNHEMVGGAIDMIDSLGENARRLLEIGIVQDRLVELGFEPFQEEEHGAEIMYFRLSIGNDETIEVNFNRTVEVGISMFWCNDLTSESEFAYTSPTWQHDLINKVKGLIECNN